MHVHQYTLLSLLLLLLAWLGSRHAVRACTFPQSLQSTSRRERQWHGVLREQNSEFSLQYYFSANVLLTKSRESRYKNHTRICLQSAGSQRFLVAHEERGQTGSRYTCIQIVMRTNNVLQFREAELSTSMDRSLCNAENLKLNPWIAIDAAHVYNDRYPCSLQGGFITTMFDHARGEGVCDSYKGQTRLYSQCGESDGLTFEFRSQTCVPDGLLMYSSQKTHCLANFDEGDYRFMLIRHDMYEYMWILRYPVAAALQFTMYMYIDLVADPSDRVTSTHKYVSLASEMDILPVRETLCHDDYELCSLSSRACTMSDQMKFTCAKTCGVCNATHPVLNTLPRVLQGDWRDPQSPGETAISSQDSKMIIHGANNEKLYSLNYGNSPNVRNRNKVTEMMFVSVSDIGCQEQYLCGSIIQNSPPVFFLKLSQSKTYPLVSSVTDPVICSLFSYETDNKTAAKYRSSQFTMIYSESAVAEQSQIEYVQCDMGHSNRRIKAKFQNGDECLGRFTQPEAKDRITLNFTNCSTSLQQTFSCLQLVSLPQGRGPIVITRTEESPIQIHCWLLPKRRSHALYLIPAKQCNELSRKRIMRGKIVPLATIVGVRQTVPSIVITTTAETVSFDTTLPVLNETVDSITTQSSVTVPTVDRESSTTPQYDLSTDRLNHTENGSNITGGGSNSTNTHEDSIYTATFVVVGVFLLIAVFQLPCFVCKQGG